MEEVQKLKLRLSELGAEDEVDALEMIERFSGVELNNMSELTEDKAKTILEFLNK